MDKTIHSAIETIEKAFSWAAILAGWFAVAFAVQDGDAVRAVGGTIFLCIWMTATLRESQR